MNEIISMISSVGFPIVACCGMGWYVNKRDKEHKEELDTMTQALNRNTEVMVELKTIIQGNNIL